MVDKWKIIMLINRDMFHKDTNQKITIYKKSKLSTMKVTKSSNFYNKLGGYGLIWKVKDMKTNKIYALKKMNLQVNLLNFISKY